MSKARSRRRAGPGRISVRAASFSTRLSPVDRSTIPRPRRRSLALSALDPFFVTIVGPPLPIWLHPVGTAAMPDYPSEKKSRFEMWWCFHWPYETSVAMVRMVFSGLFDRYPKLKIITHHLGGMIPYYDGRVGPGLKVLVHPTS